MLDDIKEKIKDKKLILFGEIHGTKEIPELLLRFFSDVAQEEDFNVCLEIPEEFQKNIRGFFLIGKKEETDGRNSFEYFRLIQNLRNLNKKYNRDIGVFCIDPIANNQQEKENGLASNILKCLSNKKTFAILGGVHAFKNVIKFQEKKIVPAANILYKKLGNSMFSINILPGKGEFYNFGIKKITGMNSSFNDGFDYILKIRKVTLCSFL